MVSILKKPSPVRRSPRRSPRRRKTVIPVKAIPGPTLLLSSIGTCKRRLLRLFTGIVNHGSGRKAGYKRLNNRFPSPAVHALPPAPDRKTVVLDLDETLVHSTSDQPPEKYDFVVRPVIDGAPLTFYVVKRPGVDRLLEEIGKDYEIVVFTAGLMEYASLVLDQLDSRGLISHRLYRDSCKEVEGRLVKDLSRLGRDLGRVVIVDDNPNSYLLHPENAIPVSPFIDDLADGELGRLGEFFDIAGQFDDMRDAVSCYLSGLNNSEPCN
ncbi:CTD small phosphatase-like protein [Nymphaea thermarum]|nr:CTD small phosphatase-like protein [Nymphaea thermarum]